MTTMLAFAVRRKEPVLLRPATATPRETKLLSDIDDQAFLRRHVPSVFFYRGGGGGGHDDAGDNNRDPVAVIRRALGEALVPYYPLAGRLREVDGGRLVVDCTGEGVWFTEADADVRLADLEAARLRPPFPYIDQLLADVEGSSGMTNCPLLLIQVTRLLCGGFVLALRFNHTIFDANGQAQFMSAVAELGRGLPSPTISPAWSRELLRVQKQNPPLKPAASHHHDPTTTTKITRAPPPSSPDKMVLRTFTFHPHEIAAIKTRLPPRLRETATTFEALTAALWRARTVALDLPHDEQVSLLFYYNVRQVRELGLPKGYYGNAVVFAAALTTAGELLRAGDSLLGDAVELIKSAKAAVTTGFVVRAAAADPFMSRARANNAFLVSDVRHAGLHAVDFGWGEPVYGGRADARHVVSFVFTAKDGCCGKNVVAMTIVLPPPAMDRFASEVNMLLTTPPPIAHQQASSPVPQQARL
ncbi:hypothetical protein PR202_gb06591 [Eleusine coracana subsp. coracana]|uniref:Benzyl alcohol O-benzoyltransferase n=1 Tax=Eleusine coracana subsp. coracana TaxID=191504 RepID=A0AAV5E9S5_ELECO|nr:hypothetical protein QOZ80_2BG0159530 [Eleusine coracana subsp. coracana]GJN19325.1 hypothetical protein PR202_gb06591 [Eleusine coracana subsp. coracana]